MGSVWIKEAKKGSGVFYVHIAYRQADQKQKQTRFKVGSKRDAKAVADKIRTEIALGQKKYEDIGKKQTPDEEKFGYVATQWLDGYVKGTTRPSTYDRYSGILRNYINQAFAEKPIPDITRGDIRDFLLGLYGEGMSKSSISLVRDVISGIMNHAIDSEMIQANPCTGILKRMRLERTSAEIDPFSERESRVVLDTCREHYPDFHMFFLFAFRTGMRLGEMLAVTWGDVSWIDGNVEVSKSYKRGAISKTKTGGKRIVDLSAGLVEALKVHYSEAKKLAVKTGKSGKIAGLPIFLREDGRRIEQNFIRMKFSQILLKAGVKQRRIHDMRHTYASLLLGKGVSIQYVKDQLGHSSIKMTSDTYGHAIPSESAKSVDLLDGEVFRGEDEKIS